MQSASSGSGGGTEEDREGPRWGVSPTKLKIPQKQPKKGRLWLNDGSCIRLRPERPNPVWSYDFVESRTHDGRTFRMLNVIDAFSRECLAIRIDRRLNSAAVINVLTDLFILQGMPGHVRPSWRHRFKPDGRRAGVHRHSGADWIGAVGAKTAFIEPGSPWDGRGSENSPGDCFPDDGLLREL